MSNFKRTEDITAGVALEFGTISENSIQQFTCKNGEVAAWQIVSLETLENGAPLFISMIYDNSTGAPQLKGSCAVLPGIDLTKGYFSSGCFPTGDPFNIDTVFYKVDY